MLLHVKYLLESFRHDVLICHVSARYWLFGCLQIRHPKCVYRIAVSFLINCLTCAISIGYQINTKQKHQRIKYNPKASISRQYLLIVAILKCSVGKSPNTSSRNLTCATKFTSCLPSCVIAMMWSLTCWTSAQVFLCEWKQLEELIQLVFSTSV